MLKRFKFFLAIATTSVVIGCYSPPCPDGVTGTVKDLEGLDGCGLVIQLEDKKNLIPSNLDEFDIELSDGSEVVLTYTLDKDAMGICMAGDIAKIDCIIALAY